MISVRIFWFFFCLFHLIHLIFVTRFLCVFFFLLIFFCGQVNHFAWQIFRVNTRFTQFLWSVAAKNSYFRLKYRFTWNPKNWPKFPDDPLVLPGIFFDQFFHLQIRVSQGLGDDKNSGRLCSTSAWRIPLTDFGPAGRKNHKKFHLTQVATDTKF